MESTNWMVGLDLGERSHGALRFARWLRGDQGPAVTPVHVVERGLFGPPNYPGTGSTAQRALALARASVQSSQPGESFADVEIMEHDSAPEALRERASAAGTGLVVGRAARSEGWSLVSLGSTARRLLRSTPGPLCIVPPDWREPRAGCILLAVEADDSCVAAARFARQLAHARGRRLLAAHVTPSPQHYGTPPEATLAFDPFPISSEQRQEIERLSRERIEHWYAEHGLTQPELVVEFGPPPVVVERIADREDACAIVVGTRALGLVPRLLQSSVATDLAGHSARPVIVIPPPEESVAT